MKIAVFSAKPYDVQAMTVANITIGHELAFFDVHLDPSTAPLAAGFPVVCPFVSDVLDVRVLRQLAAGGTQLLALRSAGFNHVDLDAAREAGLRVVRVPAYSPYAVAEHAVGLILMLNRHLHRAYTRVRDGNFALHGLVGFDVHGKTAGVVGTGAIGRAFVRIMLGFGCSVLAYDPYPNPEVQQLAGVTYVGLDEMWRRADIVSLHCPLTPASHHLIDEAVVSQMKPGVVLVNTSRGALVDTAAVIEGLKSGRIGALGLDVYEEEQGLFFEDMSEELIHDDVFARLLTFPNVVVTGHQAFLTREALAAIAQTTLESVRAFERGEPQRPEVVVV